MADTLYQRDYRWGNNNSFATRTWKTAINTPISGVLTSDILRLRFHISSGTDYYHRFGLWEVWVSTSSGGTYYEITDTENTLGWQLVNGATDADEATIATGYWISTGDGTIQNTGDQYVEDDGSFTDNQCKVYLGGIGFPNDNGESDIEFAIQGSGASSGPYYFKVYDTGSTLDFYTVTAQATITSVATEDATIDLTIQHPATEDVTIDLGIEQRDQEDATVSLGVSGQLKDATINLTIEQRTTEDATISLGITQPITLEICRYDTVNNRWTDGSSGGTRKRIIEHSSKLERKEGLNKLSQLTFKLHTNDTDMAISKGDTIALGTEFFWSGSYGSSASQFVGDMFFQGIVIEIKEEVKIKDNISIYTITAFHYVHSLSSIYEQRIISYMQVIYGGDERYLTPAWQIRDILSDVTYYDKTGTLITDPDDLPIYIRRCSSYIHHKEYTNKNKLEVLLDICKNSTNVFYCHNDAFYFEAQRPSLGTSYFNKKIRTQNFRDFEYDATLKLEDSGTLIDNSWDLSSSSMKDCAVAVHIRNYSKDTQLLEGMALHILDNSGISVISALEDSVYVNKALSSFGVIKIYEYDVTDHGDWQRNQEPWTLSVTSQQGVGIMFGPDPSSATDYWTVGIRRPARTFSPTSFEVDTTPNWVYRSAFSVSHYMIMADQIRFFNPLYPPQYFIANLNSGTQHDHFWVQGYNEVINNYCLSPFGHRVDETKIGTWADEVLTGGYETQIYTRDWSLLSDLSNTSSMSTHQDEDDRLYDWWQTDIKEFACQTELTTDIISPSTRTLPLTNLNHSGNGVKDWHYIIVAWTWVTTDGVAIAFREVTDGVTNPAGNTQLFDATSTKNYTVHWKEGENGNLYGKATFIDTATGTEYSSTWNDMGDTMTRAVIGAGLYCVDDLYTYDNDGIRYIHIYVVEETNNECDEEFMSKVKITEPDIYSQVIVIGESGEGQVRTPIGKYPDEPDDDGVIKIISKKVESDQSAMALARQIYESTSETTISFKYHKDFWTTSHLYYKPNKQIEYDEKMYYINDCKTLFHQNAITTTVNAGTMDKDFFEYIEESKEDKKEQSKHSKPIMTKFECADIPVSDIIDEPLTLTTTLKPDWLKPIG